MAWIRGGEGACRGSLAKGTGKIVAGERAPAEGSRLPRGRGWITGEGRCELMAGSRRGGGWEDPRHPLAR
jgi:hypothetical protein